MTPEDILQRPTRFLTRSTSFDTFLVFGPRLTVTDDPLEYITVKAVSNTETATEHTVSKMLFDPHKLVAFHADVMTLEPATSSVSERWVQRTSRPDKPHVQRSTPSGSSRRPSFGNC
jgi:hypothetical protein